MWFLLHSDVLLFTGHTLGEVLQHMDYIYTNQYGAKPKTYVDNKRGKLILILTLIGSHYPYGISGSLTS